MTTDKGLLRNTLRTLAFRLSATAIGGLSTVILARVLTPADMGAYSIAMLLVGIVGIIFGSAWTGIAYSISNQKLSSQVVMANAFAVLIGLTPLLVGTAAFLPVHAGFGIPLAVRLIVAGGLVSFLIQQYFLGVHIGQGETVAFNLGQIVPQVIFVPLLLVALLLGHGGLSGVLVLWALSQYLNMARILLQYRSLWALPHKALLSKSVVQTLVRFDMQVGLSGLVTFLNFRGNSFIVTYFAGLESAAFLAVALSLSELVYHLPLSLVVSAYGRIGDTSMREAAELTASLVRVSIWISVPLVLAGELVAGYVPVVFGAKYGSSIMPLRILLLGTVFYGVKDLYSTFFANQLGQPETTTKVYLAVLPAGLLAGLILVSRFGVIGSAFGNVCVYILLFLCMLTIFSRRTGLSPSDSVMLRSADLRVVVQAIQDARKRS